MIYHDLAKKKKKNVKSIIEYYILMKTDISTKFDQTILLNFIF